jgi:sialate O-acetylesterase
MKSKLFICSLAVVLFILTSTTAQSQFQNSKRLLELRGDWKFKIGDKSNWADPKLDDSKWADIYAPAEWQNEGYPGYNGYAWYRRHIDIPNDWVSKDLLLNLGNVDDCDETYINGQFIGFSGLMPPNYTSAYNWLRQYPFSSGILHSGDNVIAVRVYDGGGVGGITGGRLGIYERHDLVKPEISLPTTWKFITGDDMKWKEINFDDKDCTNVRVPSYWETQGFKDYDGYAWYRVKFKVPSEYKDKDLILLAGKIDDFDETYLNGKKIGRTGTMPKYEMTRPNSNAYLQVREYMIPPDLLKFDEENVLAVRVYDCWMGGGIWDGPLGIVTREHFVKYKHKFRNTQNWFGNMMDDIFNNSEDTDE